MTDRAARRAFGLTLMVTVASACSGSLASIEATSPSLTAPTELAAAEVDGDPGTLATAASTDREISESTAFAATTSTSPMPRSTSTTVAPQPPGTSPPTTSQPGSSDPMEIYRGYLGTLEPDQIVSDVPSFQPSTTPGILPYLGVAGQAARAQPVFVKIDNSSAASPHSGLNNADIVIEEEVEWGITRFAAIFHSQDATVGPVRSGRTTDLNFLPALGRPAFVYSGANTVTDILLRRIESVDNRSAARNGNYWRQSGRRAPSNLFASTSQFGSGEGAPPAFLHYRDPAEPIDGIATSTISISFGSSTAFWERSDDGWLRSQNGRRHLTTDGTQVSASSVVVVWVTSVDTGMVDSAGGVVPEFILLGTGPAAVLIDGQRVEGSWAKPSLSSPLTLIDDAGEPLGVMPGRTWIELVSEGDVVT